MYGVFKAEFHMSMKLQTGQIQPRLASNIWSQNKLCKLWELVLEQIYIETWEGVNSAAVLILMVNVKPIHRCTNVSEHWTGNATIWMHQRHFLPHCIAMKACFSLKPCIARNNAMKLSAGMKHWYHALHTMHRAILPHDFDMDHAYYQWYRCKRNML